MKQIAKRICQNLPDGIDVFRAGGWNLCIILTDEDASCLTTMEIVKQIIRS